MPVKHRDKVQYGDFQTPAELAAGICQLLRVLGIEPVSIVEPTCGEGSFLVAALNTFPSANSVLGIEINPRYIIAARHAIQSTGKVRAELLEGDFFTLDLPDILRHQTDPLLVLGNPPWVTNSELSSMGSRNLPAKTNFQNHRGIDALTGKSNFDISEWMLIRLFEMIRGRRATLAMLCKTAVARKALFHAWKSGIALERSDLFTIDTASHFDASVNACLLVSSVSGDAPSFDCYVHESLAISGHPHRFGYRAGQVVADTESYERRRHLIGESQYSWRSGVKHDCSDVMEFSRTADAFENGMGEVADLEHEFLFPMLKSSHVARGDVAQATRWMLIPQRSPTEDTATLEKRAPKVWRYLNEHGAALDRRSSSIYRKRPRFSVFGVGDYTFAPWKVAISGFYKKLSFTVVGPVERRPVVFDDTCYFISCLSRDEAQLLASLLNSESARDFFSAFVFWDAKRPIKVEILRQLNLLALAEELRVGDAFTKFSVMASGAPQRQAKAYIDN